MVAIWQDEQAVEHHIMQGDCIAVMRTLASNSVDALCCDPPCGIAFMGKSWDSDKGGRKQWIAWLTEVMQEALRIVRPGGHAFVWALPRTSHWTATALEDAGWEIRDVITHLFGSGFPKSHNISVAIDKHLNAEREVIGQKIRLGDTKPYAHNPTPGNEWNERYGLKTWRDPETAPTTDAAKQYDGYGTALKPSNEHWILCRKPLSESTIAANVLKWGTGGLAIDTSRVNPGEHVRGTGGGSFGGVFGNGGKLTADPNGHNLGRFPSNTLLSHTLMCVEQGITRVHIGGGQPTEGNERVSKNVYNGLVKKNSSTYHGDADGYEQVTAWQCDPSCPVRLLDEQSGVTSSHGGGSRYKGPWSHPFEKGTPIPKGDQGGASRYFQCFSPEELPPFLYQSKPSKRERSCNGTIENTHPTLKSISLMRYLVRMITPGGGTVLDCFMGSGSTLVACVYEGFDCIGIDESEEYCAIARSRIAHAEREAQ